MKLIFKECYISKNFTKKSVFRVWVLLALAYDGLASNGTGGVGAPSLAFSAPCVNRAQLS